MRAGAGHLAQRALPVARFDVTVLVDAVAAVDVESGDGERALHEMAGAGAHFTRGWGREDSNLRLTDYESAALTN